MNVIRYLTFVLSIFAGTSACAQNTGAIVNDRWESSYTDSIFNSKPYAVISHDNVFVGPFCCIDMSSPTIKESFECVFPRFAKDDALVIRDINAKHDSIVIPAGVSGPLITINGRTYEQLVRALSQTAVYVPLTRIPEVFRKKASANRLYMINDHIVTNGIEGYKLEMNFILDVEIESSKDNESLQPMPEFSVVRIYTKTAENLRRKFIQAGRIY